MTRVVVTCPQSCPDNAPNHHEIHHTKINELDADPDAILEWLYNGFVECAYCSTRLSLTIES